MEKQGKQYFIPGVAISPVPRKIYAMQVTVDLPELLVENANEPARDVFEAVAIQAYAQRRISQGKLAQLLGLDAWQTENLLARRGITRPFTSEDFEHELKNLNQALS